MLRLKLLLHYHKSLLSFNLPFSLLAAVSGLVLSQNGWVGMVNGFSLCLITGGFALALYLYEQRHSAEYYFYHNLGLSKLHLIAGSMGFNLLLVLLLYLLKIYMLYEQA